MTDWNLSDDELFCKDEIVSGKFYFKGDVKKFIRRLKEELGFLMPVTKVHHEIIDKLAGDKLK